jgi:hypothetical protein
VDDHINTASTRVACVTPPFLRRTSSLERERGREERVPHDACARAVIY